MKTQKFAVSNYLDNEEIIAEYLKAALEENDPAYFMQALGHVAKARGMTNIASETGLGRASLYKAINGKTQPKLETVFKILKAVGFSLDVRADGQSL